MPRFPVDPDPVQLLGTALAQTVALKGKATILANGEIAQAPPAIVLQPEDGEANGRAKLPSLIDIDVMVIAAIWGESRAHCWELLRRLAWGLRLHGKEGGPLVEWKRVTWNLANSDDQSLQGEPLTARFVLRAQALEPDEPRLGLVETTSLERI